MLKFISFLLILIIGILLIYISDKNTLLENQPTYEKCGVILNKTNGAKYIEHKHGDEIKSVLYMDVRYINNHVDREEVDANTYYNYEVGQHVCFIIHKDPNKWWFISLILGIILVSGCWIPFMLPKF